MGIFNRKIKVEETKTEKIEQKDKRMVITVTYENDMPEVSVKIANIDPIEATGLISFIQQQLVAGISSRVEHEHSGHRHMVDNRGGGR